MATVPREGLRTHVTTAIATLRQRGDPVSVRRVHGLIGHGSFRDVSRLVKELVTGAPDAAPHMVTPGTEEKVSMPTTVTPPRPQAADAVHTRKAAPQEAVNRVLLLGSVRAAPTEDATFVLAVPVAASFVEIPCRADAVEVRHLRPEQALLVIGSLYSPPLEIGSPRRLVVAVEAVSLLPGRVERGYALGANWVCVRGTLATGKVDHGDYRTGIDVPYGATPLRLGTVEVPLICVGPAMRWVSLASPGDSWVLTGLVGRWKEALGIQVRCWERG
jgi:hypothetical protein